MSMEDDSEFTALPEIECRVLETPFNYALSSSSNDVWIAVIGRIGSGKSTFINRVSGSNISDSGFKVSRMATLANSFSFNGHNVRFIDTLGFDDSSRSEADVCEDISHFLQYNRLSRVDYLFYFHNITDTRMGAMPRSPESFEMFRTLTGKKTLERVAIVTTMHDKIDEHERKVRCKELSDEFKPSLDEGAVRVWDLWGPELMDETARSILEYYLPVEERYLPVEKHYLPVEERYLPVEERYHAPSSYPAMTVRPDQTKQTVETPLKNS